MNSIEHFHNMHEAAQKACDLVKKSAQQAVKERGIFVLGLSGGGTPRRFFKLLAQVEVIDWAKTHVFLVDERLTADDSPYSNLGQAKELLLNHVSIPRTQIHAPPPDLPADQAASIYEKEILELFSPDYPKLDIIHLGMGSDGHTASLFPESPLLQEKKRLVAAVTAKGDPPLPRVTMTLPLLNSARLVFFLLQGQQKATLLKRIQSGRSNFPAAKVCPRELHWLLAS